MADQNKTKMTIEPSTVQPEFIVQHSAIPALFLNRNAELIIQSQTANNLVQALNTDGFSDLLRLCAQQNKTLCQTVSLSQQNKTTFFDIILSPLDDGFLVFAKDTSLENNLRSALMDSRQRFKDLVEISSDFAWEVGPTGQFVYVSQRGAIGYDPNELIQKNSEEIVLRRDKIRSLNPFMSKTKLEREEVWVLRSDGDPACLMVSCVPLFNDNNDWVGARGVCRDITDERERDAALARAYHRDQLLAYIVKTIRDEVKPENMLEAAATATARALGANGCQIFRVKNQNDLVIDADFGDIPYKINDIFDRLNGLGDNAVGMFEDENWQAIFGATRYRKDINGAICLWRDKNRGSWSDDDKILTIDVANQLGIANEQITGHERIVELSRTDALTGLLNRRAFFEEELPRHIERLEYNQQKAALIYVDLDNFKAVNDAFGHQKGDAVLLALRDFLIKHVRPGDAVARLGGDEFALWLPDIDIKTATKRCEGLLTESRFLKEFSGEEDKPLGISVGLALFDPADNNDIEYLISRADAAMYEAKRAGKDGFKIADA